MSGTRRVEPHRTTLSDVAARAGVSVTTASYILNGRAVQMRISEEATERVREAARTLAYRPNRTARSLRTASTATIGVISDHVASGQYASSMLSGASVAARAGGHVLVIGETEGSPVIEQQLVEEMLDRGVEGILYARLTTEDIVVPRALAQARVVLLNCSDADAELPSVLPDEYAGGQVAGSLLVDADRARDVFLVGDDTDPAGIAGRERTHGVRDRLARRGVDLAGTVRCPWSVVPAYHAVLSLLDSAVTPGALVCLNDRIAMGAYQALADRGLTIPDDCSVVSFDGSDLAGWLRPTLTSVSIPYAAMGAAAVEMLVTGERTGRLLPMPILQGASV